MDISELSSEQIAGMIGRMLSEKDPATVGLRSILRRKTVEADDFPLRGPEVEDFAVDGKGENLLSEDERRIIELERRIQDLHKVNARQIDYARRAVAAAYAQGHETGGKQGFDKGKNEAAEEYQKKTGAAQERISGYLKKIENERRAVFANADLVLLELCCAMVKKIIGLESVRDPEVVRRVLKQALTYVAERERVVIRVAPGEMEQIVDNKKFWDPVNERLKEVSVEPDERVEKGGCIVESNSGVVDARLGVQLNELTEVVRKAWEGLHASRPPEIDNQEAEAT